MHNVYYINHISRQIHAATLLFVYCATTQPSHRGAVSHIECQSYNHFFHAFVNFRVFSCVCRVLLASVSYLGGASQPSSRLQRKLAHGERPLSRALLRRLDRQLVLGECSAQGARLLGSEILRLESLVLVELAKVLLLRLIDDGEHSRDRLAHVATAAATTKQVQAKCESFVIFVSILYSCLARVATAATTKPSRYRLHARAS